MKRVIVIIPAFNEEDSVSPVVSELRAMTVPEMEIREIIVVNNGSTDRTAEAARGAGATVVNEPVRGYGSACLRGMQSVSEADVILFIDADGSDVPSEWPLVAGPVAQGAVDLVIGSRVLGKREAGALLPHARFGNWLATTLMRTLPLGNPDPPRFTDLGPFRAISWHALQQLGMEDRDFGWTVEMQLRALSQRLRCREVPVSYRRRSAGRSKIAGTLTGSFRAGVKILSLINREFWRVRRPVVEARSESAL